MVRDQMLCIVAPPRAADLAGLELLIDKTGLDELFECMGCVHFASLALLPPRPTREGTPAQPTLMLELAVDEGLQPREVIDALVREGAALLRRLYRVRLPGDGGGLRAGLRDFLLDHTSLAAGGFIGRRDRSVRQIHDEAALSGAIRVWFAGVTGSALVDSRVLGRAVAGWLPTQPAFAWAAQPSPRGFWRARWMRPSWLRVALVSLSLGLPAALVVVSLMGLLAVGGVLAVWAGGSFIGDEVFGPAVFGDSAQGAAAAVRLVVGASVALIAIVTLGTKRLFSVTVTFASLLALGVAAFTWPFLSPSGVVLVSVAIAALAAGLRVGSVLAIALLLALGFGLLSGPFLSGNGVMVSGAMLRLVGWGFLILLGLSAALFAVVAAAVAALAGVPRYFGVGAVVSGFAVLLSGAVFGAHLVLARIAAASSPTCWPAVAKLKEQAPVFGVPAVDVAVLQVGAMTVLALVLLWSLGGGFLYVGRLLDKLELPRRGAVPRAQQVHPSIEACEADLAGKPNHLISLCEIRRPYLWNRTMLRWWLWFITRLGHVWFTEGRLGRAEGIQFGHWHVIDRGRRLLFCSNYDGSFGGYLDEFILGASQGANLFWRWTELQVRAAAGEGHPAVEADREFPPTTMLAFRGCWHEQWFKTYARDSMLPHLYRFEAYWHTNKDIERATLLRDAVAGERTATKDDRIMRAIES